ncbi:MAG: hypothetical protein HXX08_01920 [Chloroflexi bacterium]|uniref:Uncharacterized protein n=1 Tax=Candidatus Chlorohelix allophototropha TaxID=3003348 RepID=A0A8T7LWM8_9CHLR|nr:hypothetical protein [Chloroflexota bacterium]WJW66501.1 hypothetical protein OZ401_002304 [Chloroflexota bacterium L227-S17]
MTEITAMKRRDMTRQFASFWGGTLGFVTGAALAALLFRRLGLWPHSDVRIRSVK